MAPRIADARAEFRRARRLETAQLEHGMAVCEMRFRPRHRRGGWAQTAADWFAGFASLGLTALADNANEPDIVGLDLALVVRFGHGPLWLSRAAWDSNRAYVSYPIDRLNAGESVWMRLEDIDSLSANDVLGEWNTRFEGVSPLAVRDGRASVECRFLSREHVERRVGESLRRASRELTRMTRVSERTAARLGSATHPLDVAAPAFDTPARRADLQLALARANTTDPAAWHSISEAERTFDEALAPLAAARRTLLHRAASEGPSAPFRAFSMSSCNAPPATVRISLMASPDVRLPRGALRAVAVDARGMVWPVRLRARRITPVEPNHDRVLATGELRDFDASGRHTCGAPDYLVVAAGNTQWVLTVSGM